MKIIELVAAAKAANPDAFGNVADPRAARIVAAALAEIGKRVDATVEGPVPVMQFGRFVVKRVPAKPQAPAEQGANPSVKTVLRRVIFHRLKPAAVVQASAVKQQ